jgi:hypothetical protein
MTVRRACKNWMLAHPPPSVESVSDCQDQSIHVIIVGTSGHRIMEYNPPENIQHKEEIWLTYMDLEHTRHYLSTTMTLNVAPSIPPPTTRGVNGNSGRTRRVTGSTEPINDPISAVGSSSRIADSIPPDLAISTTHTTGYFRKYSICVSRLCASSNSKWGP